MNKVEFNKKTTTQPLSRKNNSQPHRPTNKGQKHWVPGIYRKSLIFTSYGYISSLKASWYKNQLFKWAAYNNKPSNTSFLVKKGRTFKNLELHLRRKIYKRNFLPTFNVNDVLNNLLSHNPIKDTRTKRNSLQVNTEFYQLWFQRNIAIKKLIPVRWTSWYRAEGLAHQFWSVFRHARFSFEARGIRNRFALNWSKANMFNTLSKKGNYYFKPLEDLLDAVHYRLKFALHCRRLAYQYKKEALRARINLSNNLVNKQKYLLFKKVYMYYRQLSNVHKMCEKEHIDRYRLLYKRYLLHVRKYPFTLPKRITAYFNILTGYSNCKFNSRTIRGWKHHFNITNRKVRTNIDLLKKRFWSSLNHIDIISKSIKPLFKVVKSREIKGSPNTLKYWPKKKPVYYYKLFRSLNSFGLDKVAPLTIFSKTSLKSKKLIIKLKNRLQLFKKKFLKKWVKQQSLHSNRLKLLLKSNFLLERNFALLRIPSPAYYLPYHLRKTPVNSYGLGLTINLTHTNYFFTLVNPLNGAVRKVFSAGSSKGKTTRIRRSPQMFLKVFNLLIDYLKQKNINKLKFIRVIQRSITSNFSFQEEKKLNWYPSHFKRNNIRVRRWIYELKRVHGGPLRAAKLRRK